MEKIVMKMRPQRKTSRSISHADRTRDNTCVNSRGPPENNLVETPATHPKIWSMVPRATRPGPPRYLKLAVAGVLCMALVLLAPHVVQERSHRALPDVVGRNRQSAADKAAEDKEKLELQEEMQKIKDEFTELTIYGMVDFLLSSNETIGRPFQLKKDDPELREKLKQETLLLRYHRETEGRVKDGFTEEQNIQFIIEMVKAEPRYLEMWAAALHFYTEVQRTHQHFYVAKYKENIVGGSRYIFRPHDMSGIYIPIPGRPGHKKYMQKRFGFGFARDLPKHVLETKMKTGTDSWKTTIAKIGPNQKSARPIMICKTNGEDGEAMTEWYVANTHAVRNVLYQRSVYGSRKSPAISHAGTSENKVTEEYSIKYY